MDVNEISFENLPKAVAHLTNEIAEIKSLFRMRKFLNLKKKFLLELKKYVKS
jgi:hypothetical protein